MNKIFPAVCLFVLTLLANPEPAWAAETIVLNPGHGGYDTGIRTDGVKEKDVALDIARQMEEILKGLNKKVHLTRRIDEYLSISERVARASKNEPDLFLSIHLSDGDDIALYVMRYEEKDADVSLKEYYNVSSRQRRHLYESTLLAHALGDALGQGLGVRVYQREMPLPLMGSMGSPAVHVELPSRGVDYDVEKLRVASILVLGILNYERTR